MSTLTCRLCKRDFDEHEPVKDESLRAIGLTPDEIAAKLKIPDGYISSEIISHTAYTEPIPGNTEDLRLVYHCQNCWASPSAPWNAKIDVDVRRVKSPTT